MINLKYIKNQKFNETKLVEVLFYTFPLWFIVGNLAVSLNTLLFIVASLFLIQRKQLKFRFNSSCWFLIAFFLYLFILTTIRFLSPEFNEIIQNWIRYDGLWSREWGTAVIPRNYDQFWSLEKNPIFKSFLLIRFLILIFVIDILFFNNYNSDLSSTGLGLRRSKRSSRPLS